MSEEENGGIPQTNQPIWMSFVRQESELLEKILEDTQRIDLGTEESDAYREVILMLTYAYYFQSKKQLLNWCSENPKNSFSDNDFLLALKQNYMTEIFRIGLQKTARSSLDKAFAERFWQARNNESKRLDRENQKINSENTKIIESVVKSYTKFRVAVGASVVASVIYSLLLALFVFIATATNPNNRFSRAYKVLIGIEEINSQD